MEYYKTVILPVEVCTGGFCYGGDHRICSHFDCDGGLPTCRLNLSHDLKFDKENRIPKPEKCRNLKEL